MELYHYGVLGMHWGIRRYQNKDGSLTKAGKQRYSGTMSDVYKDLDSSIAKNKEAYQRVQENNSKIPDSADKLGKMYTDFYGSIKIDSDDVRNAIDKSVSEYKSQYKNARDPETKDFIIEEAGLDALDYLKIPDKIKSEHDSFRKLQDQYFNDVRTITSAVEKKYSNTTVLDVEKLYSREQSGAFAVDEAIDKKLHTFYNAFISRHFEDYWIYDTDAMEKARVQITEEVKKALNK